MIKYNIIDTILWTSREIGNATIKESKSIYNIKLHYDNGIVTAISAKAVIDGDKLIHIPFDDIVKFELDGEVIEVQSVDGIATIDFTSEVAGEYIVKTINTSIQNDEVIINV